jgi:nitrilase
VRRAPPPNWPMPLENQDWMGIIIDISQSIQRGIELIHEAKANGATLVAFPELWFPG